MIDILVLNYNDAVTTTSFVNSVKDYSCVRKILVVDNHSKDNSFECLKALQNDKVVVVDSGENKGYGAGNNFGIRHLYESYQSEYILLSNPDVVVEEKVLVELEDFLRKNRDFAIAAPFMLNAKGEKVYNSPMPLPTKIQYILSFCILSRKFISPFGYKGIERDQSLYKNVDVLPGSLFLMRTSDMIQYGMYDENIFLYCEEVVLGKKLKDNMRKSALLLHSTYIHNHSVSISKSFNSLISKQRLLIKSKMYVIKKYFQANLFELLFARLIAFYSLFEIEAVSIIRQIKQKG